MRDVPVSRLVRALEKAIHKAGKILLRYEARAFRISLKGPVNLVTEADHAADRAILKVLKSFFPEHAYLTEESVPSAVPSRYRWIIDPLDGTTNFAHRLPHSCVSIGLEKDGKILLGGVLDPFRGELFTAVRGRGARLNGRSIRVSKVKRLIGGLLVTGFPYDRQRKASFYFKPNEIFLAKSQGVRRFGAAALDLAYVACGRLDGYWEFLLQPWDVAAGGLLVEEAGGKVTDYRGTALRSGERVQIVATNGRLHREMVRILKKFAAPPAPGRF